MRDGDIIRYGKTEWVWGEQTRATLPQKKLLLKWWANSDALKLNLFSSPINIRLDAPKLICLFASVDQVQCILCENEISVELASKKFVRTSQETAVKEKCCDKKKKKNKHADLLRHLFARIIDGH